MGLDKLGRCRKPSSSAPNSYQGHRSRRSAIQPIRLPNKQKRPGIVAGPILRSFAEITVTYDQVVVPRNYVEVALIDLWLIACLLEEVLNYWRMKRSI